MRKRKTKEEYLSHIINKPKDSKGCILFSASIRLGDGKSTSTNRFVYENTIGEIPEGKDVGHRCGVLTCCNPKHLFIKNRGDITRLDCANRKTTPEKVQQMKCLRNSGKSVEEISEISGTSISTVKKYISGIRLSTDFVTRRRTARALRISSVVEERKKRWVGTNKFESVVKEMNYSKKLKGHIAEAATIYRLLLHNFSVYSSIFDGECIDILAVNNLTGLILKIQVRCVKPSKKGSQTPMISSRHMIGRYTIVPYTNKELDFLVGYDLCNDNAYVFSWNDIKDNKATISCTEDSKECWSKLTGGITT